MPNWSSNALIVKSNGSKESERELDDFIISIHTTKDTENGILNLFVPIDPALLDDNNVAQGATTGGMPDWYNWRVENWGTKWDVFHNGITFVTSTHMVFDTAWSPPVKWLTTVSEIYPRLTFELAYSEQGMGFAGVEIFRNGEVVSETEIKIGYVEDYDEWVEANPDKDEDDYWENSRYPEWDAHMEKYSISGGG